jgi:hypothetical protein
VSTLILLFFQPWSHVPIVIMSKSPAGKPLGSKTGKRERVSLSNLRYLHFGSRTMEERYMRVINIYFLEFIRVCLYILYLATQIPRGNPLSGNPRVPSMPDKWSHTVQQIYVSHVIHTGGPWLENPWLVPCPCNINKSSVSPRTGLELAFACSCCITLIMALHWTH